MSTNYLWSKDQLAEVFSGVCGTASDFGGWTPEAAAIVSRLCQALDIAPSMPTLPADMPAWTVATIDAPALPSGQVDGGAVFVVTQADVETVEL